MKNKLCFFILAITLTPIKSIATTHYYANDYQYKTRFEFSVNFSDVVARFTGNKNLIFQPDDPFLVMVKITDKNKKRAYRLGTNANYQTVVDFTGQQNRRTRTEALNLNTGYEWRKKIDKKIEIYTGADVRYFKSKEETTSTFFSSMGAPSSTLFDSRRTGFGASYFVGFVYNFTSRVSVFTESHLSFNSFDTYRTFSSNNNTEILEDKITNHIQVIVPMAIHLLIKL